MIFPRKLSLLHIYVGLPKGATFCSWKTQTTSGILPASGFLPQPLPGTSDKRRHIYGDGVSYGSLFYPPYQSTTCVYIYIYMYLYLFIHTVNIHMDMCIVTHEKVVLSFYSYISKTEISCYEPPFVAIKWKIRHLWIDVNNNIYICKYYNIKIL